MELINWQAYGFRNFENYRLKVKVLCSWKGLGLGPAPVLGVEPDGWCREWGSNPHAQ